MATIDDLRAAEGNVKAALGQLADTMQQKLDALQQKIDQGVPAQDFQPDVDAMSALTDQVSQIAQEEGRSAQPAPQPPPPGP